jgi:hypothetical protein
MNVNRNKSTIMQLLNFAYNDVRFYNFNNFSDITENRRYQGYLFLGICRCNTFFLSLLQISGWKFPLGFSPLNFNLVCWKRYCSTDYRAEKVKISYIWNLRLGRSRGWKRIASQSFRYFSKLASAITIIFSFILAIANPLECAKCASPVIVNSLTNLS